MNKAQFDQKLEDLEKKSPAKLDVLKSLLAGKTVVEIAEGRGTHRGTVGKQISELYKDFKIQSQLGVSTQRPELIGLFTKYKPEWVIQTVAVPIEIPKTPLTGTVPPDDPRYLERMADRKLKKIFTYHQGESSLFIRIRGAKGIGKSSLLARLRQWLEVQNHIVASVHLESKILRTNALNDFNIFLYDFTSAVSKAFKNSLETSTLPDLKEHWRDDIAAGVSCTEYLKDYIFSQLIQPKTLLIDGIDLVMGHELVQNPFLDVLRAWNEEQMKKTTTDPIVWPNLVLAYSTSIYAYYNIYNSPINVGYEIELEEFTLNQIAQQAKKYGLNWDDSDLQQIKELTGGHPELMDRTLYLISQEEMDLTTLFNQAYQLNGKFSDYLRDHLTLFKEHPNLAQCFKQILNHQDCHDEFAIFQLEKAGLIKKEKSSGRWYASCKLYQNYFQKY
ncbi:MAG: AAA-like domain-containing protein [Microcystaceae cyanobacterium]